MYGKKGNYFNCRKSGFHNSIWIELIGFDKDKADYGVNDFLSTVGFIPDSISLHLTGIDWAGNHQGMENEYILPPYVCSYGGRSANDERQRQNWTNYDLRGLIKELQAHNIAVFSSFFDLCPEEYLTEWLKEHKEVFTKGPHSESYMYMIKRLNDGTYYEDHLIKNLVAFVKDYNFDGVQIADGISSPRLRIWHSDFSDDLIEQSGIEIPKGEDACTYINKEKRKEWIEFYRQRWGDFLSKMITALKSEGALVAVNSAWTQDPLEALYRYGTDYKRIDESGADYFIVEDVSSDLAILGYEDNRYRFSYEERKMIHYEFVANLMCIRAMVENMKITPLFMVWDNLEQWDVLHHMPTAMQRAAAANFTHFCMKEHNLKPITDGPHFCLGDGLKKHDWDFIKLTIDNGYTPDAENVEGGTFIWSNSRMERELDNLLRFGAYHSARLLALLMRRGAAISKVVNIKNIDNISGDIVVTNYDLLEQSEKNIIDNYKNGRVIRVDSLYSEEKAVLCEPVDTGWPTPLNLIPMPEEYIVRKVKEINENVNARFVISKGYCDGECNIREVITGKNTSKIIIENNEYYYVKPHIVTKRKIKSIKVITKPEMYPLIYDEHSFKVRVSGRGAEIAEVEYEG